MITPNIEVDAEKVNLLSQVTLLTTRIDGLLLRAKSDSRCNQRWVDIAAAQLQQGCMALERAVVRLDKDRL